MFKIFLLDKNLVLSFIYGKNDKYDFYKSQEVKNFFQYFLF